MNSAIEINHLTKHFTGFSLEDLQLNLPCGSIMGFIGENGAGKTTTIKLILNQLKKDTGSIKIFGLDHITDEKRIKEDIGVVFDESYFHENLRPKQISKVMNQMFQNWDEKLFLDHLDRFQIPLNKTTKEFSRGMKMKLSIATALSHHPKLLILDEATSGLDPIVRNEILDLFLEFIQDESHSILLSSHITSDLEKVADYITFIHQGKLVLSESKDHLRYNYGMLLCGASDFSAIDKEDILGHRQSRFGHEILVKDKEAMKRKYKGLTIDQVSLEDIMLFYVKEGVHK
ncbi:ABC transporter ATP-binding protein [Sinanaerobacter chloroacetimidivorans]|uniref:ABC transporter ATP-binding protein n=1 Tax=Sinanaerobacter chloroacetimidivorans TaxID=2818044 RepID=A0A8J7VXD0_9FIRM|nr:ABC transporter ATP-binding protein [Sinanaerobacter chloroacetimidivorans]MBR0596807.1 ABC transporter ATP-binding protein [Sinanaerobacter chloroacetimidivorans]